MFVALDLYDSDPAQHLIPAEIGHVDHDLPDMGIDFVVRIYGVFSLACTYDSKRYGALLFVSSKRSPLVQLSTVTLSCTFLAVTTVAFARLL